MLFLSCPIARSLSSFFSRRKPFVSVLLVFVNVSKVFRVSVSVCLKGLFKYLFFSFFFVFLVQEPNAFRLFSGFFSYLASNVKFLVVVVSLYCLFLNRSRKGSCSSYYKHYFFYSFFVGRKNRGQKQSPFTESVVN